MLRMISVFVSSLLLQFVAFHLLNTLLLAAVLTKSTKLFFGLRFFLLYWRLEKAVFSILFSDALIGLNLPLW